MALIDLTNVNPWGETQKAQREADQRRAQSFTNAANFFSNMAAVNKQRRDQLAQQSMAFRDKEYSLINKETDQLVQPKSNSNITDLQIQKTGQRIKQEYYDAVKAYQASDKGDEARAEFEKEKQRALGSARTISGALSNLQGQMETFRKAYNAGGISNATNPAVREFMINMINPETPEDMYQIVPDEESGQLKYIDTETGGQKVNFFLDDIANGENQFSPIVKVDMPDFTMKLMKDVTLAKKQIENDLGVAQVTDWDAIGVAVDGRLEEYLKQDNALKAIAAEEGFGWDAFKIVSDYPETGIPYVDVDGTEYTSAEQIKEEVKREIMRNVEELTPHTEEQIYTKPEFRQPTLAQQANTEEALKNQQSIDSQIGTAAEKGDVEFFRNQLLGKVKGVDDMKIDDKGRLIMYSYGAGGKGTPQQIFDLTKMGDKQRLSELFGGSRDLSVQSERASKFKSQL